jgi:hypothetical protein
VPLSRFGGSYSASIVRESSTIVSLTFASGFHRRFMGAR